MHSSREQKTPRSRRGRGFSAAIVGVDGSGKTTIAKWIAQNCVLSTKYVYMGSNLSASNVASPTRHLARSLSALAAGKRPSQHGERRSDPSPLWILNLVLDEVFRSGVTLFLKLKGHVVIHDRHYAFDYFDPEVVHGGHFWDRAHRWFLANVYPKPDLVIWLDAPAEVLYDRKPEGEIEAVRQRCALLKEAVHSCKHLVRIDATRPLMSVREEILGCLLKYSEARQKASFVRAT